MNFCGSLGGGALLKGLDLVLEVFVKHPELTLHVVGSVDKEPDFMAMYERELTQLANIHFHGHQLPNSAKFHAILGRAFCFIAPSASEATSPAVITLLQAGLFPILSRDTGVNLPAGCGPYLEECTIEEIEQGVLAAYQLPANEVEAQVSQTQTYAVTTFTRERFHASMREYLTACLADIVLKTEQQRVFIIVGFFHNPNQ